jgi:hypothetical protein
MPLSLYMERVKDEQLPAGIPFLPTISTEVESDTRVGRDLEVSRLLLERESNVNNQKLMGEPYQHRHAATIH